MTAIEDETGVAIEHLSVQERAAAGRAARRDVPRSSHGDWEPAHDRRDPVDLLTEQEATRVPELVPLRRERMLASPFAFFRGAAYVMAADLARTPRTRLETQLCGDAHLSNFGVFAAPDRRLVFDVNDFDETLPGPFEWDVKRLAASFAVAGRDRGLDAAARATVITTGIAGYRDAMRELARCRTLELWYARVAVDELLERARRIASRKQLARTRRNVEKARSRDSLRAFAKLTEVVDGAVRIRSDPPVVVPVDELAGPDRQADVEHAVHRAIRSYRTSLPDDRRRLLERFRHVDTARKVVGVGSVGTRAWIALMLGRDDEDPLFLQIKEAEPSVLEPFLEPSVYAEHGRRVVEGQRLMQAASDVLLGWIRTDDVDGMDRHYYVRQLWDAKGSAQVEELEPDALAVYARLCGGTLARAHARAGDAVAIGAYLGRGDVFDRAMVRFAEAYADQNERDHAALRASS